MILSLCILLEATVLLSSVHISKSRWPFLQLHILLVLNATYWICHVRLRSLSVNVSVMEWAIFLKNNAGRSQKLTGMVSNTIPNGH